MNELPGSHRHPFHNVSSALAHQSRAQPVSFLCCEHHQWHEYTHPEDWSMQDEQHHIGPIQQMSQEKHLQFVPPTKCDWPDFNTGIVYLKESSPPDKGHGAQ